MSKLEIKGIDYELEFDHDDPFVAPSLKVAYCHRLAKDFVPIFLDPRGHGSKPHPPEFLAYRLIVDSESLKLCILFEVYWRRQDCTWREINKDHDHDYEQIQVHFNMKNGKIEKVIISSVGPLHCAGHGTEVYSSISKAVVREVEYTTSPRKRFPWGNTNGKKNFTQVREMPIRELSLENGRPVVEIINCYHAFAGLKPVRARDMKPEERTHLIMKLEKLDREMLEQWYYHHLKNRFGHDISQPFKEPYTMYYPPPEDVKSRLVYGILYLLLCLKRILIDR